MKKVRLALNGGVHFFAFALYVLLTAWILDGVALTMGYKFLTVACFPFWGLIVHGLLLEASDFRAEIVEVILGED